MARLARLAVLRSVIHFHRLHIHSEIRYVPLFPQNHHQCERYHPPTGYNRSCLASLGCGSDQAREKAEKKIKQVGCGSYGEWPIQKFKSGFS